jgi:hypothetical protein
VKTAVSTDRVSPNSLLFLASRDLACYSVAQWSPFELGAHHRNRRQTGGGRTRRDPSLDPFVPTAPRKEPACHPDVSSMVFGSSS